MRSDKLWICGSHNGAVGAIVLFRSPFKKSIEKKLGVISYGHGFVNWTISEVDDEEYEKILLNKFEPNTLYTEEVANA